MATIKFTSPTLHNFKRYSSSHSSEASPLGFEKLHILPTPPKVSLLGLQFKGQNTKKLLLPSRFTKSQQGTKECPRSGLGFARLWRTTESWEDSSSSSSSSSSSLPSSSSPSSFIPSPSSTLSSQNQEDDDDDYNEDEDYDDEDEDDDDDEKEYIPRYSARMWIPYPTNIQAKLFAACRKGISLGDVRDKAKWPRPSTTTSEYIDWNQPKEVLEKKFKWSHEYSGDYSLW